VKLKMQKKSLNSGAQTTKDSSPPGMCAPCSFSHDATVPSLLRRFQVHQHIVQQQLVA
jgi:hypothetical protein